VAYDVLPVKKLSTPCSLSSNPAVTALRDYGIQELNNDPHVKRKEERSFW
jgi:hypothetical protein